MALKMILNKQTDFTGEFPVEYAVSGLWRFNDSAPDEDTALADSSGCGRNFTIINWSGTTANLSNSPKGRQIRFNINNPKNLSFIYTNNRDPSRSRCCNFVFHFH